MLTYPYINPVAFSLGPLQVHWYGLMYALGFIGAWILGNYRASRSHGIWSREEVADLIFYAAIGVIIGGRLGYMVFYDFPQLISEPLKLFKIWEGGMSFHGGLLGVLAALWLYARHINKSFFAVTDFAAPLVPFGLAAGRIGNFINGELWGRTTTVPWAMVYPHVDASPRHPSQIYEFLLEGILLFVIMFSFSAKPRPTKAVSGLFSLMYGLFRIIAEFFREPDPQYGYLAFGWLTMGQVLSIPMVLFGIFLLYQAYQTKTLQEEG